MEEKENSFVKIFWEHYEDLHQRYKKKCDYFENAIDIFSRILNSLKSHQKVLNTIVSKNYILYPDENSTQAKALNSIKKLFEFELSQIDLDIEVYKNNLTEQFRKLRDNHFSIEKENYAQLTKTLSRYNDAKLQLEKYKNKYNQSMKLAESSLRTAKTMKIKSVVSAKENQITLKKLEDKAKDILMEAKKYSDKYSNTLKEAKKIREEVIDKQKSLIEIYEKLELKDYEYFSYNLTPLINRLKEENEAKKVILDELEQDIKSMDNNKDLEGLMESYKTDNSDEKPDDLVDLVQYEPQIDFEKASNPEEYKINHEIILAMKNVFPDIMPNFDIEKESRKQEMRELSKKIFAINVPFTDDEKKKLMDFLQEKWSQNYFLIYLSRQRTQGRFARSQKLINDLADILTLILDTSEQEKDYEAARNCMILSQTYYYEEKDKDDKVKKIYLLEFISSCKWFRNPEFWRGIIQTMIDLEIQKYLKNNPDEKSLYDKDKQESRERLSNFCFSQLLPYSNNMREFYMDDRVIIKIIDEFVEKYYVPKEFAESIYGVINPNQEEIEKFREEYKNNPNLENELLSLEEVRKQRGME
jgi:hypothetical protein